MSNESIFPKQSVQWRMMSSALFFENAVGFVSATFYTRIVNCPSRTNSGMESALFTDDGRFKQEPKRYAWHIEKRVATATAGDFDGAAGSASFVPDRAKNY